MAMSKREKVRTRALAKIERLQSEGLRLIEEGQNPNDVADKLLRLSRRTADVTVAEMAIIAHAGIATGQLVAARAALASVNDQIASATNTFALAARIAQEGETNLTFPFVAGKAASFLDLLKSLETTIDSTAEQVGEIDGIDDLIEALDNAKAAVSDLKDRAEELAS